CPGPAIHTNRLIIEELSHWSRELLIITIKTNFLISADPGVGHPLCGYMRSFCGREPASRPGPGLVSAAAACRLAWPASRAGGWLRGPCPAGFLDRAHQAGVVAVGIGHDRMPGAPEGVDRRLSPSVARRGQFGIAVIDCLAAGQHEPEDDLGAGR